MRRPTDGVGKGGFHVVQQIARRFEPWRQRHARLSRELRDQPYMLIPPTLM